MNVMDLLRRHGIEPKKAASSKGGEYHSPCPGCGGNDRFCVWPDEHGGEGGYWCRRCNRGGDAIQFLRDFDGLTFRQACERLGRTVPDSKDLRLKPAKAAPDTWQPRDPADPDERWRHHAGKLVTWAYEKLMENEAELRWLASRGIGEDTAHRFALGWVADDLYRDREAWGLLQIKDEKTGKARPMWLPKGLVIPWYQGETVAKLRIRRPDPVEFGPRYYMVPGSASVTTLIRPAVKHLVKREVYVIVESELDAYLIVEHAGDLCGAVALGSCSAHPDIASSRILAGAAVILNALDFDGPGAQERTWWEKHFPQSRRWPVPEGKDPGEAYKAGVNIKEWIRAGLPEGMRR